MTMRDEYIINAAQYERDMTASVKCCCCDQYCPKDEAAEYNGEWFDIYCAKKEGLRMCAQCGVWSDVSDVVTHDGDWYHRECIKEAK